MTQIQFSRDALKTACAQCNLRELCVPGDIPAIKLEQLDTLVAMRRRVKRGHALFRDGADFTALYAVRSGVFKTRMISNNAHDQITGFHMPGELLGLDGVATEHHNVDAIALEDSEVCVLPYADLERIAREFQPLQRQLHRVMSRELVRDHGVMALLGSMKAEERVAAFLINLSERFRLLGYSADEFMLRMTREEIGNYLGLKLETVSRFLSRFHEQKIIIANRKMIKIIDRERLRDIARGA